MKTKANPEIVYILFLECIEVLKQKRLFDKIEKPRLTEDIMPILQIELNNSTYVKTNKYNFTKDSLMVNGYYCVKYLDKRNKNINKDWDVIYLNSLSQYAKAVDFSEYASSIVLSGKESININNSSKHTKFFFESLKRHLYSIFSKQPNIVSPLKYFEKENGFHFSSTPRMLALCPSLFYNLIDGRSKKIKVGDEFFKRNLFQDSKGYLLCHALSIHIDSIYLFAEIGRYLKFCHSFKKSNRKVLLTDKDFAKLNWVVQNYSDTNENNRHNKNKLSEEKINDHLFKSKKFRTKLYKHLNIDVVECGYGTVNDQPYFQGIDIDEAYITNKADDYHLLCKYIFEDIYLPHDKLDKESYIKHLKILDDIINNHYENTNIKLYDINLVRSSILPYINFIKQIIEHFKSYNTSTFKYFLLQYYNQYKFDDYLKIAIYRESKFDEIFKELKKYDVEADYSLYGLYFDDYSCFLDPTNTSTELHIHANYFPSGTLYSKLNKNLEEAEKCTILISDKYDKIENVLRLYNNHNSISILISDLLSFAHFYFKWDKNKNLKSKFVEEFETLLSEYDSEFYHSWIVYTKSQDDFNENLIKFEERMMTYWEDHSVLPYWFLPYVLNRKDEAKTEKNLKFYASFIDLLLRSIEKEMDIGFDIVLPRIK